jgi:hypothetical protein
MTNAPEQGDSLAALMRRNDSLREGYVVGVHYPGDVGYEAKSEILYDVACKPNSDKDSQSWHLYANCRLGVRIGGTTNDFMRYTLRCPRGTFDATKGLTKEQQDESTLVVIQCENGLSQFGIIIGFGEHPKLGTDTRANGHYWQWNFNGMVSSINKYGEYAVTYSGNVLDPATNSYKLPPENTAGSTFMFLRSGGWLVHDAYGESISLDNVGKRLMLLGRSALIQTSEGNLDVKTKGKVDVQATGNAVFNSTAKVYIGKEGATEPLVLGNKLAQALKELIDIISAPVIGQAGPFPMVSNLVYPLKGWAAKYGVKNTSPFLSRKGFVT